MAEDGFYDLKMRDFGEKYPEYEDMNRDQLKNEYNRLSEVQDKLKLRRQFHRKD